MRYYIFAGPKENWNTGIQRRVWGATETIRSIWDSINLGDIAAFYVTSPISRVIGFGRITRKERSEELIWPREINEGRSIWTYKVYFDILHAVNDYRNEGIKPRDPRRSGITRGINPIASDENKQRFRELARNAESEWGVDLSEITGPLPQQLEAECSTTTPNVNEAITIRVKAASNPVEGANVLIDNDSIGLTNTNGELEHSFGYVGSYTITATKEGYTQSDPKIVDVREVRPPPEFALDDINSLYWYLRYIGEIASGNENLDIDHQRRFEDTVYAIFKMLQLDVEQKGYKSAGAGEPDGIIKTENWILYDCKSTSSPYNFPINDRRAIKDYARNYNQRLEPRNYVRAVILISHGFADGALSHSENLNEELVELTDRPIKVILMTTTALIRLLELSIRDGFKSRFFERIRGLVNKEKVDETYRTLI